MIFLNLCRDRAATFATVHEARVCEEMATLAACPSAIHHRLDATVELLTDERIVLHVVSI